MALLANAILLEDAGADIDPTADTPDTASDTTDTTDNSVIPIADLTTYPYNSATPQDYLDDLKAKLGPGNYLGIASRSGVSRWHVGNILSGRAKGWSVEVAEKIAQAAGVTLDELREWWRLNRQSNCART